ncbi:hypothetical protein ES319_A08G108300v1 [Gossypium barbadense]|uniref:Ubiquitin-like domain-containing protein n=2 Tax=Gossypium TaxID=3633 RepID=A0A5J5UPR4_GOSBA|nr:hypothetical protein ES319_A08G108300v1 [Gossypium barbadense]TYH05938.1 hypothetical protein ES288_A08G119000v1 [Gossypium darwinii]
MMRVKTKATGLAPVASGGGGRGESAAHDLELRPGGMLVQKRNPASDRNSIPPPTIRVRVKYGSIYHEISISSQATFGELKKMLTGPTGLHHQDQKLLYKDKERDSKAFLDMAGVKDKSKIVLVEDPIKKASKSISQEVDRLAGQVSAFETIITKGGKVAEKDLINSIELLMNQLLKLDGITADGDIKLQRKMQVRRVQKYVETLDMLKIKNAMPSNNGGQMEIQNQHKHTNGQKLAPTQEQKPRHFNGQRLAPIQEQQSSNSIAHLPIHQQHHQSASGPVVVTTNWETFDTSPTSFPVPSASTSTANNSVPPKFPWDFFG